VIWLHNFSWHVGSIAVAAMIALFVQAARKPGSIFVACLAFAMSIGFATLGVGLAIFGSAVLWATPAPYVWSVIAVVGTTGLGFEYRSSS
jgi:CHASE2 domain-containing sensor protein